MDTIIINRDDSVINFKYVSLIEDSGSGELVFWDCNSEILAEIAYGDKDELRTDLNFITSSLAKKAWFINLPRMSCKI